VPLPWIKVHSDLIDHPKALALAHRLGDSRAWSYVVAVWFHLARYNPEGWIRDTEDAQRALEAAARWSGDAGALVSALVEVGFMERKRGRIVAHGWDDHQGAHVEKRARDRERQAAIRRERREEARGDSATTPRRLGAQEERERKGDPEAILGSNENRAPQAAPCAEL